MEKLLNWIFLLLLLNNCVASSPDRIISGKRAKKGEFPFFVQMFLHLHKHGHAYVLSCGATLIHPKWILSAAHCFPLSTEEMEQAERGSIAVLMGTNKRMDPKGSFNTVSKIHIHPEYTYCQNSFHHFQRENDIAVAELRHSYLLNKQVQTVLLPPRKAYGNKKILTRCTVGTIIGVGVIKFYPPRQYDPYVKYVEVQSKEGYEINVTQLNNDFYSEVYLNNGHVYQGDSGGPYICYYGGKAYQFGVISVAKQTTYGTQITGFVSTKKFYDYIFSRVPNYQNY